MIYIMHIKFYAISFNRTQDLLYPENAGKIVTTASPSKLYPQKLYQYHLLQCKYIASKILYDSMQQNVR